MVPSSPTVNTQMSSSSWHNPSPTETEMALSSFGTPVGLVSGQSSITHSAPGFSKSDKRPRVSALRPSALNAIYGHIDGVYRGEAPHCTYLVCLQ